MKGFIFLIGTLAVSAAASFKTTGLDFIDMGKNLTKENKDSMDDDIVWAPGRPRSALNIRELLWTPPIPYVFESSLDMNAKGVILRAMEQFRLKSCIDFKPRDSEEYYISMQKLNGCFSFVGRVISGGQNLSIGQFCDQISVVEHELLHAAGFFHEQSRYDRDEFVTIVFENIIAGAEFNFQAISQNFSTTGGLPYDYDSVMHYGQNAFSNGNGSTIITKDPEFQDKIGQRLEMSPLDVKELNLLYRCNSTISFKMHCSFNDSNMCQMSRCSRSSSGWEMRTSVGGGPSSDHTNLPDGSGVSQGSGAGFFMHASTVSGQEGDSAFLETDIYSSRGCHVQCLQFFYYQSGNESDQLNIYIREFQDEFDATGTLHLMDQITGQNTSHWQFKYVSLNASKQFQVVFEARKGAGSSSGGFSVDDVNLSELECPDFTIQIDDFENVLNNSASGSVVTSTRRYSRGGYAHLFGVLLLQSRFAMYLQLLSGVNDDQLEWPVPNRQVTLKVMDQKPDIQLQMSQELSLTSDLRMNSNGLLFWDDPRKNGTPTVGENNETIYAGFLLGFIMADQAAMKTRSFLLGGSAVFHFTFRDITPLVNGSVLPCPNTEPVLTNRRPWTRNQGPCSPRVVPTTSPSPTTDGNSTTGFSPGLVASPVIVLLLPLMLFISLLDNISAWCKL